ncbi:MAG: NAD(P)/FAD-dependent oxidoreductase [Thermoplasmatota archaeon]
MGLRIVILGAGHGGLRCAWSLARRLTPADEITVVARENYFLYYPFLRDLVAGAADLLEVAFPLRDVLPTRARLVVGALARVADDGRSVTIDLPNGEPITLACDHLIIAMGSVPSLHGVDGAEANALPFKSLEDALALRLRVLDALEVVQAGGSASTDVVIAGGGSTGLEVAGALHDLFDRARREYRAAFAARPPTIHIVEGEDRLLPGMRAPIPAYAARLLAARGDQLLLGEEVASVSAEGAVLKSGRRLAGAATVWTAGLRATPAIECCPFPRGKQGRITVDSRLRVADGVWAIGDCAGAPEGGTSAPMTAQSAESQAEVVASNIVRQALGRSLHTYEHATRGAIVPLGGGKAAAEIGRHALTGRAAGLLWRGFHLAQLPGTSRRVRYVAGWVTGAARQRALVRAPALTLRPSNRRSS